MRVLAISPFRQFGTVLGCGIALVFTGAGFVGLIVTIIAFNSKYYRDLSAAYAEAPDEDEDGAPPVPAT